LRYKRKDSNFFGEYKYPRVDKHVRILKPMKRITKVNGKEYIHFVICTSVPKEWKDGVRVTIEPIINLGDALELDAKIRKHPKPIDVKEYRKHMRDLYEQGPKFEEMLEKHFQEEARIARRDAFFEKVFESRKRIYEEIEAAKRIEEYLNKLYESSQSRKNDKPHKKEA